MACPREAVALTVSGQSSHRSPRPRSHPHERAFDRAAGVPIMARWFRQRVSPATAPRPQRCPAITLQLQPVGSPRWRFVSARVMTGGAVSTTASSFGPPRAKRSLAERVPCAVLGIGVLLPGDSAGAGESRSGSAFVLSIDRFHVRLHRHDCWSLPPMRAMDCGDPAQGAGLPGLTDRFRRRSVRGECRRGRRSPPSTRGGF